VGGGYGVSTSIAWRPSGRLDFSMGPRYQNERPSRLFISSGTVAGVEQYVVGQLVQQTVSLATRGNFTFTPTLSFQLYAEPFMSSGKFRGIKRVADPLGATEELRFDYLRPSQLIRDEAHLSADFDANGTPDLDLGEPDFTVLSLRSTAVLRWEYRPASTVFLVWQQDRGRQLTDGRLRFGDNLGNLFGAQANNALILKVSHWLSVR
jgi:hypothetical protein